MAALDLPGPAGAPEAPVLLLHGSPIRSFDLRGLAEQLARQRRVLLPDLPGFGKSQRRLPDYSFAAHADYLRQWLDQLGVARVHVVAYSQGGGAALTLSRLAPERVASLTLVSSIGVQELEMLGDYDLNQGLYSTQLFGLRLVDWLVPHFGALDRAMLNLPYARNFRDSDQRPLRGILESYSGPLLILHGRDDVLVPPGAAREHARLVPQSTLVWMDGGHLPALVTPGKLGPPIRDFLARVDAGLAETRTRAAPERRAAAAEPFDRRHVEPVMGLALVILMTLIVVGTFVGEDLSCIGAGLLAAHGVMTYRSAALAAFIGVFVGDLLLFYAGRYLGRPFLRRRPFRWFIREDAIEASATWFDERGPWVIFLSRLVPGSRTPTYFTAGLLHRGAWKYIAFFAIAGGLWTPALVWVSMTLGGRVIGWLEQYRAWTIAGALLAGLLLWVVIEWIVPAFTFKGRRLLVSKWRRRTRWEFWPLWIVYPPVVLYVLWLGLKHRGLTLFTACNPAMPASGFLGESKSHILRGLAGAGDAVARWTLIPEAGAPDVKVAAVQAFIKREALDFPVVLKPDVGQRGLGVAVIRDACALRDYLARPRPALIAQEFAPGHEFGVFYYRHPDEPRGHILAITDKRLLEVVGDGRSNVERLILLDDRAVCLAPYFLRHHQARLHDVPARGQRVALGELGTHCRGALFLDGAWANTPALAEAVDRISLGYAGYNFGRYDVRAPSVEDFKQGRGFKIIELNGVTSEATSIYDPAHGLFFAWRMLMRQWRIAMEIGAAHRARGVRVTTARELLSALLRYRSAPEA